MWVDIVTTKDSPKEWHNTEDATMTARDLFEYSGMVFLKSAIVILSAQF